MKFGFLHDAFSNKRRGLFVVGLTVISLFSLMACSGGEEAAEDMDMDMGEEEMDMEGMDMEGMDMGDSPDVNSEVTQGDLVIKNAWSRPNFTGDNGGAYVIIENTGSEVETLLGAESEVAGATEIHQMIMKDDVMSMEPVSENLQIPAGGQLELKSGSYHIMLIDLQKDLAVGDEFTIMLNFEIAGMVMVTFQVYQG